jgi:hypothetical protein
MAPLSQWATASAGSFAVTFGRSACTTGYIAAYLLDGTLPPAGTVCPANPNPFVPEVSATARSAVRTAPAQPMVGLPPAPARTLTYAAGER